MDNCLVVDAVGCKGHLALMWRDKTDVQIQSYSNNQVEALVSMRKMEPIRFTGFYGFSILSQRQTTWELLRNLSKNVKEDWIIGGDFNEIMDENEKSGGRR